MADLKPVTGPRQNFLIYNIIILHEMYKRNICNFAFKLVSYIAPDKAAYCVFTQFRGPENAIKLISVRTKTQ